MVAPLCCSLCCLPTAPQHLLQLLHRRRQRRAIAVVAVPRTIAAAGTARARQLRQQHRQGCLQLLLRGPIAAGGAVASGREARALPAAAGIGGCPVCKTAAV